MCLQGAEGGARLERVEFIRSVQAALGKEQRSPETPYHRLQETLPQIEEKAHAVRANSRERAEELLQRLAEVSRLQGWEVYRASDTEDAQEYMCNLTVSSGAKLVVRSGEQVFERVPVDGPLSSLGVEVTVMTRSSGLSREAMLERAAEAAIGITGVDYAIAETGSVVVMPRPGLSRLVSLLPPVHVALVRSQEVLESLEDVFILWRLAYYQGDGDMGSYMNFITGPSRTADIEQKMVVGVHGPREAHMVLLE